MKIHSSVSTTATISTSTNVISSTTTGSATPSCRHEPVPGAPDGDACCAGRQAVQQGARKEDSDRH